MQVIKLEEHGYNSALYGFSLSYKDRAIPREEWWCFQYDNQDNLIPCEFSTEYKEGIYLYECSKCEKAKRHSRVERAATANAGRGKGHDKWLRQVQVWLDIEAPRYWWSEFDTYKIGTVAQSESTMHTLSRRELTADDLESKDRLHKYHQREQVSLFNRLSGVTSDIQEKKSYLPESYLQRRIITLNYAVLRCIIEQRKNHRLPEWHTFINAIYAQMDHPELLPARENNPGHHPTVPRLVTLEKE